MSSGPGVSSSSKHKLTDVGKLNTTVANELERLGRILLSAASVKPDSAHLCLLYAHDRLAGVPPKTGLGHYFLSSVATRMAGRSTYEQLLSATHPLILTWMSLTPSLKSFASDVMGSSPRASSLVFSLV